MSTPPVRDRMPTLELVDDDLLDARPIEEPRRSTPPPPPPIRSTIVPALKGVAAPRIRPLAAPPMAAMHIPPPPQAVLRAAAMHIPPPPQAVLRAAAMHVAPPPQAAAMHVAPPLAFSPVAAIPMPPAHGRLESVLDPTEVLFDSMAELGHVAGSWQAASLCATALAHALRARAVVVHSHDLARRELRVIGVHGEGAADLLGSVDSGDDDLIGSAVLCNEKSVTLHFDGELPRLAPRRLEILGAPRTLVAVPAMSWGRCVAMIEVIDADPSLAARVLDATAYVAEQFVAYLAGRLAA